MILKTPSFTKSLGELEQEGAFKDKKLYDWTGSEIRVYLVTGRPHMKLPLDIASALPATT